MQYIYQIKNEVNGIKYYGRTNNPKRRKNTHFSELERNIHINSKLQNSYNKHGRENFSFSILEAIEDDESIFETEEKYLNLKEEKFNLSKSSRSPGIFSFPGAKNPFYGKRHSEETKKRIGEKASIRYRGENNPFYGKKHSEETKKKIGTASKNRLSGIPKTEKTKEKMRENNPKNRKVSINGKEFRSVSEASRYLGVDRKTISYRIESKSNKFNGYKYG